MIEIIILYSIDKITCIFIIAGNMYNNIINVENISFEFFISFFPLLYSDAEFIQ